MSFNKITIVGYLGQDPELRYTPQGTAVCKISVATTEKRKNRAGEAEEHTIWFRVSIWGRQGEMANEYLARGRQVYVEGRLRLEEYTDRGGNTRISPEVSATDVQFLGPRGDSSHQNGTLATNGALGSVGDALPVYERVTVTAVTNGGLGPVGDALPVKERIPVTAEVMVGAEVNGNGHAQVAAAAKPANGSGAANGSGRKRASRSKPKSVPIDQPTSDAISVPPADEPAAETVTASPVDQPLADGVTTAPVDEPLANAVTARTEEEPLTIEDLPL